MSWLIEKGQRLSIYVKDTENSAVKIAAQNLAMDLEKVMQIKAACENVSKESCSIVIHTLNQDNTMKWIENMLPTVDGVIRKEGYVCIVKDKKLYIAGADRRGTIYGIYDFCRYLGVSPWHFWADVPEKKRDKFELADTYMVVDYPSVEYRGVFINDEEELERWVQLHMGEATIGIKTYEKIFELILRLKGNYIWQAMHVNSFNMKQENGALAELMGIVVGTSHCDMLMRSNNREWKPWLEKKGYTDIEYDYSIEGRNREVLDEYWRESVLQNKDFEVSYTLGMRGIHDSGFETKTLKGLSGKELLDAKIDLLSAVINAQQKILEDTLGEKCKDTMKTFVPYKEVLELYNNGLKVPEEFTLIWANDNYGHIRRFPNEIERKRKGGTWNLLSQFILSTSRRLVFIYKFDTACTYQK